MIIICSSILPPIEQEKERERERERKRGEGRREYSAFHFLLVSSAYSSVNLINS